MTKINSKKKIEMKKRIRNKMMNNPGRYKLHQYLKYARQWVISLAYKGRYYTILDNGKVVIIY
jgi:hypothetical protein|nr:MAG TPA: hypothetical protein [Caudoviricetes sp.]